MEKVHGAIQNSREAATNEVQEPRSSIAGNTADHSSHTAPLRLDMARIVQPPTFWAIRQSGNQIIDGRTDRCITTVPMEDCLTCGTCVTCGTCSPCATCFTCLTCSTS
jgi:hypothetical protein